MPEPIHLFIIDPISALNLRMDTSLRLAWHLQTTTKHSVMACTPRDLQWIIGAKTATALAAPLLFSLTPESASLGMAREMPLSDFAIIYMRKDPPCDLNYLSTTWMLQSAGRTTKLVNEPRALQSLNEKMATFLFPDESIPACVSASPAALCSFAAQYPGELIAKPLDLFGGRGIERLSKDQLDQPESCLQTMERITESGQTVRILQPFRSAVAQGEIRAFYGFGQEIAWCLKIPKEGGFLANTAAGARLEPYQPSSALKRKIDRVAAELLALGAYFVGFDIIAEEISEINLTSPRLLYANTKQRDEAFAKLTELCRLAAMGNGP